METKFICKNLPEPYFVTNKLIFLSPNRELFAFGDNFFRNFDFSWPIFEERLLEGGAIAFYGLAWKNKAMLYAAVVISTIAMTASNRATFLHQGAPTIGIPVRVL